MAAHHSVAAHGGPDGSGDSPQVLADNGGAGLAGLQGEHCVQLLSGVPDICALTRVQPRRHPVQPVESHHVVDPNPARMAKQLPKAGPNVRVSVFPNPHWIQRRKAPVLPEGEKAVGRGAARYTLRKYVSVAPG